VILLFHRLRLSPMLGFMLVGVAVGPFGLATLADRLPLLGIITLSRPETIQPIAELGISTLMFMIGLELSLERLRVMRRLVFGFGLLQFVLCAVAIAAIAYALGAPLAVAAVAGPALAMSSTAVVVQVLASEKRLGDRSGEPASACCFFRISRRCRCCLSSVCWVPMHRQMMARLPGPSARRSLSCSV
jgi:CPA2 family monovalent cation:H+ antiporter-2